VRRPLALAATTTVLLLTSACGGDDEDGGERATPPAADRTATERARTAPETSPTERGTAPTSPEEQPGGAGDELPARSQALFTGRGGRITPRVVRVPPFLSIRAELRSADGRSYGLRFGRKSVIAGGPISSASAKLEGLRPGRSIVGAPLRGGNAVRIEASAEPGP
jgi:hypothetical protein